MARATDTEEDEHSGTVVRQMLKDFDALGYKVGLGVVNATSLSHPGYAKG